MKVLPLLVLIPLGALAQPLPLAWPDQPAGTVLYVAHPTRFTGSSTVADDGRWITTWCDMRDGRGRLFLQKLDPDHPSAGAWRGEAEGLGPVEGLAGPPAALSPVMPQLAPAPAGGAYLLWQDAQSDGRGDLLLQRVGDGAGGQGEFLWEQDLVLVEDLPLPYDDCRDPGRCRSWMDSWRRLAPDGTGGVWVAWRTAVGTLQVQHVAEGGQPDPDFPAAGLELPVTSWEYRLLTDPAGNLLVIHTSSGASGWALAVLGVRPDGGWLLPEISRVVSEGDANTFDASLTADGRLLLAWTSESVARTQLLDTALESLWTPGGELLSAGPAWGVRTATGTPGTPLAVAWGHQNESWQAQLLDDSGHAQWTQPVSLEVLNDGQPGSLEALVLDAGGLAYLFREDEGLHVQRLDLAGHAGWDPDLTRLGTPGTYTAAWDFRLDADGGLRTGWTEYRPASGLSLACQRLSRRDLDGVEQVDPAAAVFLTEALESASGVRLLQGDVDPLLTWQTGDSLYSVQVNGHDGRLDWGFRERPVLGRPGLSVQSTAAATVGTWLAASVTADESGRTLLEVCRVDEAGQLAAGPVQLAPAALEDPGYFDQQNPRLTGMGTHVVAAWEHSAANLNQVRVQLLDGVGTRRWGEAGLALSPAGDAWTRLLGLAPFGNGTVGVLWGQWTAAGTSVYLQVVTLSGALVFAENGGRGLGLGLDYAGWSAESLLQILPDGTLLAGVRDQLEDGLTRWRLVRVDAEGHELWRHTEASVVLTSLALVPDDEGSLWLGRGRWDGDRVRFQLERRSAQGAVERIWSLDTPDASQTVSWALTHADGEHALVLLEYNQDANDWWLRAARLPEGDAQPIFAAPAPLLPSLAANAELAPAPLGDVWLSWSDHRGSFLGYGLQSRLTRLDVLHVNTAVDQPAHPAAFRLEPNRPNPFNPETILRFTLAQASPVRLEIFNLAGQRVRVLQDGELPAGAHSLRFDARDEAGRELGSGLYVYRLSTAGRQEARRMLLLR
ncbi:MAG: FlgD immunoglobulin-like domain containing protein [Candidatus Delongbacteria bacterium]